MAGETRRRGQRIQLTEIELKLLRCARDRSGRSLIDFYSPLTNERSASSLYLITKTLAESGFLQLKKAKVGREYRVFVTDKGRQHLKKALGTRLI